jgi:hypothetical protein
MKEETMKVAGVDDEGSMVDDEGRGMVDDEGVDNNK